MEEIINEQVREILCPERIWQFSDVIHPVYKKAVRKFPLKETSQEQERYPTTRDGMGAYLDKFFARHYFQVQESILTYLSSQDYFESLSNGSVNILDIGSGPGVASLAIADLTNYIVKLREVESSIKFNFVLNDTSALCLGLAKELLHDYFKRPKDSHNIFLQNNFFLKDHFPKTLSQIQRISRNLGHFDIVIFSYVIDCLNQQEVDINKEIVQLKEICSKNGQILIVQDKYNEDLMNQIFPEAEKNSVTNKVYSEQNKNDYYTYEYCQYLMPLSNAVAQRHSLI